MAFMLEPVFSGSSVRWTRVPPPSHFLSPTVMVAFAPNLLGFLDPQAPTPGCRPHRAGTFSRWSLPVQNYLLRSITLHGQKCDPHGPGHAGTFEMLVSGGDQCLVAECAKQGAGVFSCSSFKLGAGDPAGGSAAAILAGPKALCRWPNTSPPNWRQSRPSGTIRPPAAPRLSGCWQPLMRLAAATAGGLALPGDLQLVWKQRPQLSQPLRGLNSWPADQTAEWWGCSLFLPVNGWRSACQQRPLMASACCLVGAARLSADSLARPWFSWAGSSRPRPLPGTKSGCGVVAWASQPLAGLWPAAHTLRAVGPARRRGCHQLEAVFGRDLHGALNLCALASFPNPLAKGPKCSASSPANGGRGAAFLPKPHPER